MDQQQEQREGKGGDRERGVELQKERDECGSQEKRKQSWRWAGGGRGAPGRGDGAAWTNSSVAHILLATAARTGPEASPEPAVKLQALPRTGECQLPKLRGGLRLPEQGHTGAQRCPTDYVRAACPEGDRDPLLEQGDPTGPDGGAR